jgi:L-seryl-tRNA(Ser) seleniumtransferase
MTADVRRRLPAVEALVAAVESRLKDAPGGSPDRAVVTRMVRRRVEALRESVDGAVAGDPTDLQALAESLAAEAASLIGGTLRPVINASGVVLQTNLGRAPLSEGAGRRLQLVGMGYSNLEYDLAAGRRGERSRSLAGSFAALLGVPAIVVNNNAASLVLALSELARGREVVVSRGELIEIGGSFRLPDVMRITGARLVEVGTTNRTRLADYRDAITPRTAMLLKVHTSNFQVVGFVQSVPVSELAPLARERALVMMDDLGSGSLLPTETAGLAHEPTVQDALAAGADLVAFSGDKLLGGPQAGIVAGRPDLVSRLGKSVLYRALRPDKLTLVGLEATLGSYLRGAAAEELPLWRMLTESAESTRARAAAWARTVGKAVGDAVPQDVVEVESAVGGGSLPGQTLKGYALAVGQAGRRPSAATLADRLRHGFPAVVGRVQGGRLLLDPRTVISPREDDDLATALIAALRG